MLAAIWKNDVRHWLILLNIIAFSALIIYLIVVVLSPRRAREESGGEENLPANLTEFLPDEDLEGRRLERVQGWALLFAAVIAIALPLYWLREPTRQNQSKTYFNKNSVARGATLFASAGSPNYDPAVSLQCANCHGAHLEGGVAPTTVNGVKVSWKAPPLNTEALRFTEDPQCLDQAARESANPPPICELTDIITYGRPGTPMQAWGVEGGGPKNPQAIADIIAFIEANQITPAQAQAEADNAVKQARADSGTCPEYMTCPGIEVKTAQSNLTAAKKTLDTARSDVQKALNMPGASDADLTAQCKTVEGSLGTNPNAVDPQKKQQGIACGAFDTALSAEKDAQAALDWSLEWQKRRANVSDGQLLFEYSCARCHTQGWSIFDPSIPPSPDAPNSVSGLGLAGGGGGQGGGIGFNLRDGGEERRFGGDAEGGFALQQTFVSTGSQPFKPYGIGGIGSGKMPGFGQMLTQDQIGQIVAYERYCLSVTTFTGVTPTCDTAPQPRVPPSTTTSTAPAANGG
jgi:mono/diheme cytochrome c family protein